MSWVTRRTVVLVLVAVIVGALAAVSMSAVLQSSTFIKPVQAQYTPNHGYGHNGSGGHPFGGPPPGHTK